MKDWLLRNKIYFETIAAILLSIMAIIVTINSNRIAEVSKEISYRNALPNFEIITMNDRWDALKNTYLERKVIIYHVSGKYKNFNTELISFYDIVFKDSSGQIYNIRIPLKNYLFAHLPGEREERVVRTIKGFNNQIKSDTLRKKIEKALNSIKCNLSRSYVVSFLKMEYIDLIDNKVNDYYNVTFYESKWLSVFKGTTLFDYFNEECAKNIYIDIDDLNEKKLKNLIRKIHSGEQNKRPRRIRRKVGII